MDELEALAAEIGEALKARGEKVAVNESSAGGLISAALLSVPGASAYFLGGAVVYTPKARVLLTDIPKEALAGMRSSSEPYAMLLARNAAERYGATWGISETGAAGPTGNPYGDAPGHTCVAVSGPREAVLTIETGSDDRSANMRAFAAACLELFRRVLDEG
jgi:nicotinamide-nucleotide amidase